MTCAGGDIPGAIMDISPWIDMRIRPFDEIVETTAAQTHRRFLKTDLALDGVPYRAGVQHLHVGRDLRDVFMSLRSHDSGHSDAAFAKSNDPATLVGDPLPRPPEAPLEMWRIWTGRGWLEWGEGGSPCWSSSHHARTWWGHRCLPNLLFVHFADLLAGPGSEIRPVADFLGIELGDDALQRVVDAVRFDVVKRSADEVVGRAAEMGSGGRQRFLNRGRNGRWREVLDAEELRDYEALVARAPTPKCARWLEEGRRALVGAAND